MTQSLNAGLLTNAEDLEWLPMREGLSFKLLHVNPASGGYSMLLRVAKGTVVPRHRHLASAQLFVLEGAFEFEGGVVEAGTWGLEPPGAVHAGTTFTEDSILYYQVDGATALLDEDDTVIGVYDGLTYRDLAAQGGRKIESA